MSQNYKIDEKYHKDTAFFGQFIIKNIRVYKGMTQKQLGEIIGKKEITVRTYENGRSRVSIEILFLAVRRLDITRKEFVKINSFLMESSDGDIFLSYILDDLYPTDEIDNPQIKEIIKEKINETLQKKHYQILRENIHSYFTETETLKYAFIDTKKITEKTNEVLKFIQLLENQKEELNYKK